MEQPPIPAGVRRARRTAATARATFAVAAAIAILSGPRSPGADLWTLAGFTIIFATAGIQLLAPGRLILIGEESLAPVAAVLIVGIGPARVSPESLLWLSAVACGVLARGGRQHWIGRTLLLVSLGLPIVLHPGLHQPFVDLCIAAIGLLLTCGRVTRELRAMAEQARWEADHDPLTGVLSRPAFRARLNDRAAAALARGPVVDQMDALVVIDLDNFGAINKQRGHAAGDEALLAVAQRLVTQAGPDGLVGRLGGDEFAAVLQGPDPRSIAERTMAALAPLAEASIGVALLGRDGHDADSMLRAGDVALRVAKRGGRGQLSVYTGESMSDSGPGGARNSLERLICGEGLSIVMQPIVDLTSGRPHAYEALARFAAGTTSSPVHWFALAEELGARDRLELACLEAALGHFDERPPGTHLSVNLSAPLLTDARTRALLDVRPDLRGLIIELTENSLIDDTPELITEIFRLCGRGAHFALDDMGVGYSGLKQLTTVRPHYLKLDRGLISGIDADADRAALVSAMLGYAEHTGGRLVAEGVETSGELATLRGLGVTLIQGFYFGRPAPPWPSPRHEPSPAPLSGDTVPPMLSAHLPSVQTTTPGSPGVEA